MKTITAKVAERQFNEGKGVEVTFYDKGVLIGRASTVFYKGKPNNFLHGVEVQEEYHRQGYGTAIVAYMINKYDVRYLYVKKHNKSAIKIYESFGFKEIRSFAEFLEMEREKNG